jgi:hypothetical protein
VTGLLLAILLQTPGLRSGRPIDEGTFVVRQDTVEMGREAFRLVAGRVSPGAGAGGWTLATTVRYDRLRPVITLAPILEVSADTLPVALQYDVSDPREPVRILGQLGGGRFTVRFLSRASERAREFLANGPTVVLDDSVYAPYVFVAWQAGASPLSLTAIVPRGLRRETVVAQHHGRATTVLNRESTTLQHVTVRGGANGLVHLWLDESGRLLKVEIPTRRITAERAPPD